MTFCLAEGKVSLDREFMVEADMCSHQRDEAHGRLALRCCAVTKLLEVQQFHMSTQKGMGTGATNITQATDKAWQEFCTAAHGAPRSKRRSRDDDFNKKLYNRIRNINVQIIIDAASDETLSARQFSN